MSGIANANTHANTHHGATTGTTTTGLGASQNAPKPSKVAGTFHDTKGAVKEGLGRATGAHNMAAEGRQEKLVGKEQKQAATAQGYSHGAANNIPGQNQSMHGSIAGDRGHQTAGEARAATGNVEQKFNSGHAF